MVTRPLQFVCRWFSRAGLAAGGLLVCLCLSGCRDTLDQIKGEGFHDEFSDWGEKQRPAGDQGELSGVSTKSQQIERNLGVR
ncbi:MAG TPA: hypothetical protein VFE24_02310 [Pirellulales bacterium]|jgi:hypothetical protein|nr:hypothetical protein [Pirellulales bacterium]